MFNLVILAVVAALAISLSLRLKAYCKSSRRKPWQAVSEADSILGEVKESRALSQNDPDRYLPELAINLKRLAGFYMPAGRSEEALSAVEESVKIYRGLPSAALDELRPELADSLNEYGRILSQLGRHREALAAAGESVEIMGGLARQAPGAYDQGLAAALHRLSDALRAFGQHDDQTMAALREALDIRRNSVPETEDDAFGEISLLDSLTEVSDLFMGLKEFDRALALSEEAAAAARARAESDTGAGSEFSEKKILFDLAETLDHYGRQLDQVGRSGEARSILEDAVQIFRKLLPGKPLLSLPNFYIPQNPVPESFFPELYRPGLMKGLNNLSRCLLNLDRPPEALAAAEESYNLGLHQTEDDSGLFWPLMIESLEVRLEILRKLHRDDEIPAAEKMLSELREILAEKEGAGRS